MDNLQDNQPVENENQESKENQEITFSDEQQAKINELIAGKIAKERAKEKTKLDELNKQHELDVQEAVKKAQERAKMTAEQRAEAERKERDEEFKQQMADLKKERRELQTKSLLIDKGLPSDLLPLVMGVDDEDTSERLSKLEKYVNGRIEEATKELMKGKINPSSSGTGTHTVTQDNPWSKDNFNITKQAEIAQSDPETAKKLIAEAKPTGFYVRPQN